METLSYLIVFTALFTPAMVILHRYTSRDVRLESDILGNEAMLRVMRAHTASLEPTRQARRIELEREEQAAAERMAASSGEAAQ
jgi:hypothetical protein